MKDDDNEKRLAILSAQKVRRTLDAKIELLWKLGEPREMTKMTVHGSIPVISDIDKKVAFEAVQAICEKYQIGKHDQYMFRRAHLFEIYYGLGLGCPVRIELGSEIDALITWH